MEKEDKLMIKKIAIVPYVTNGRNSQVGHDGHFNIFKKKRSTVLKENLQSVIKAKNWEAEVIVDVNHGDLQSLKREGVNLFLIPEDIARYIDYSSVSKDECFELTHDEYESGNTGITCQTPAKKYKLYKSSINKSLHFAQRRLSSSTRGQSVTAQLNLSRE